MNYGASTIACSGGFTASSTLQQTVMAMGYPLYNVGESASFSLVLCVSRGPSRHRAAAPGVHLGTGHLIERPPLVRDPARCVDSDQRRDAKFCLLAVRVELVLLQDYKCNRGTAASVNLSCAPPQKLASCLRTSEHRRKLAHLTVSSTVSIDQTCPQSGGALLVNVLMSDLLGVLPFLPRHVICTIIPDVRFAIAGC
ncbi:hypothetical protein HPB50_025738 [Hyalomma asiaticum]|uniref:Uncharacterized protein n=1 Tax=Hyalomma asiaticum TaxID=266040 RepID=A0ACB7TM58_HYAAI|nr:hypothetical protein HPB50_025738 [Hyalomma asiaticum]